MAHLWIPAVHDDAAAHDADATVNDGATAGGQPRWSRRSLDAETEIFSAARLLRCATPDGERWVIIGPPSVRVNGLALDGGIAVLRDRDELCCNGERVFFSTETLAVVTPYPDGERTIACGRCGLPIEAASPAVACPWCGLWHHQRDDLPCWTHIEKCSRCDQATALDADFTWTPEEL